MLAAYAVSLGFALRGHYDVQLEEAAFDAAGVPGDSLQFTIGDVHVWDTARGWRVSRLLATNVYESPQASDFYAKLKDALDEGARNWRDR